MCEECSSQLLFGGPHRSIRWPQCKQGTHKRTRAYALARELTSQPLGYGRTANVCGSKQTCAHMHMAQTNTDRRSPLVVVVGLYFSPFAHGLERVRYPRQRRRRSAPGASSQQQTTFKTTPTTTSFTANSPFNSLPHLNPHTQPPNLLAVPHVFTMRFRN